MSELLKFINTGDSRTCSHCGSLLRLAFEWVRALNTHEVSEIISLHGDASIIRMLYPEETWADPIWEHDYHMVRRGREGYSDDGIRPPKRDPMGDLHMLKLVEKIRIVFSSTDLSTD